MRTVVATSFSNRYLKSLGEHFHRTIGNKEDIGKYTVILWRETKGDKTNDFISLSKSEWINDVITTHLGLQAHLHRIYSMDFSTCGACEADDESLKYFLCYCPAFTNFIEQFLGIWDAARESTLID